jgi:hypothetical protein
LVNIIDPRLIDRIYECSFVPELWPSVLGELAAIATARAGFLFLSNADIHHFTCSSDVGTRVLKPLVASRWVARSERFRRFLAARNFGFFSDGDIYTAEEKSADPFYRDILFPRGLGWAVGTTVPLPTGDRFAINLEREHLRGPVELAAIQRLDLLRPHIARSALMTARLQLERARATSEALARVRLPALVLDGKGKVLAANHLIEKLTRHIRWGSYGSGVAEGQGYRPVVARCNRSIWFRGLWGAVVFSARRRCRHTDGGSHHSHSLIGARRLHPPRCRAGAHPRNASASSAN